VKKQKWQKDRKSEVGSLILQTWLTTFAKFEVQKQQTLQHKRPLTDSVSLCQLTRHFRTRFLVLATSLATCEWKTYYFHVMALIPIKTASETGYCDCICGCYELASLRDEDTGKGYCPACGKDHVDLNAGVGIPQPAPARVTPNAASSVHTSAVMPFAADPPGRLR
jgi:hypothetical protein